MTPWTLWPSCALVFTLALFFAQERKTSRTLRARFTGQATFLSKFLYWYSSIFPRFAEPVVFVFRRQSCCLVFGPTNLVIACESVDCSRYRLPQPLILTGIVVSSGLYFPISEALARGVVAGFINSYKHVVPCNSFIPISGNCI